MRRSTSIPVLAGLALALGGAVPTAAGQETGATVAGRAPQFLLAAGRASAPPMPVDVSSVPVLRRRVTLDLDHVGRTEALSAISRASGLRLVYADGVVPREGTVRLKAEDITVAAALTEVLLDAGVDVVLSPGATAVLVKRTAPAAPAVGVIQGRVTDAKTGQGLDGAEVFLEGTRWRTLAGREGHYRLAEVEAGSYTLLARRIGYGQERRAVTVTDGREAAVDVVLQAKPTKLDEVVVTGTVVPTELKAVPIPVSVVTADVIEQLGITRLDQLFRGEVVGIVANDQGEAQDVNGAAIFVRGSTSTSPFTPSFNAIKTYVDGVELTDPLMITNIDPRVIERVEIVRGPQGSTIYGSQAINGVMQIFTKKGARGAGRPAVAGTAAVGVIETRYREGSAVRHEENVGVTGGTERLSYSAGGSVGQVGSWLPGYRSATYGLHGGFAAGGATFSVEGSARFSYKRFRVPPRPYIVERVRSGQYVNDPSLTVEDNTDFSHPQQTVALTARYLATPAWQHQLTLGQDQANNSGVQREPLSRTPTDTLLYAQSSSNARLSGTYSTTYTARLGMSSVVTTAGVEHWRYTGNYFLVSSTPRVVGNLGGEATVRRQEDHNTGVFGQTQVGLFDAFFLTAGLRAEDNPNVGAGYGWTVSPRVGGAYVLTVGGVTLKARAGYGEAIRPPLPGLRDGEVGRFSITLPNDLLRPDRQRGFDGGIELYGPGGSSLQATYYDQRVTDLISFVNVAPDVFQWQNLGRVRNRGVELEGTVRLTGALSLRGSYSSVRSRVMAVQPGFSGSLLPGDELLGVKRHTGAATVAYDLARTSVTVRIAAFGSSRNYDWAGFNDLLYDRDNPQPPVLAIIEYPAFIRASVRVSHVVTSRLTLFAQVENLSDDGTPDWTNDQAVMGRSTTVGVSWR